MIDGAEESGPVAQQRAIMSPAFQRARAAASARASSLMQYAGRMSQDRKALLALAAMAFVACYLRFLEFGLYEDDLNQTRFWSYTAAEMASHFQRLIGSGAGGRPLGQFFLHGGFWAGFNIGGAAGSLPLLYAVSFAVLVTNAFLTFKISKAVAPVAIALLAGFAYILYPADALKITIVRGLAVQPSLTFGLGAILFYINKRYVAAYFFAVLALGVYEFGILPFLTAPFFIHEGWRTKIIRFLAHGAISAGVIGAVVLIRLKFAAGHLTEIAPLSNAELLHRFYVAWTAGPWTSAKAYFTMPAAFFRDFELWQLIVVAAVFAISLQCLKASWRDAPARATAGAGTAGSLAERANRLFGQPNPYRLIIAGIAAWVIAYSMAVSDSRYPPTTEFGRVTSVHTGATFGASLTFAGVVWLIADLIKRFGGEPKRIVVPVVAFYFSLLGGFQAVVQSKCIASWQLQQHLWRQIVSEVPDWQDGTVVIVGYPKSPNSRYVYTMSWATWITAKNMLRFPAEWKLDPIVVFEPQLAYNISEVKGGRLWLKRWPLLDTMPVNPKKLIYFSVQPGNVLKREQGKFSYKNLTVELSAPAPAAEFERQPLYDVLIGKRD